ncbi:glycoside hydrolase family 3 protein [Lepidopterella palustris CBS 459.81]|uniref:Probable beta-glucosidase E n=1 Tax=Lepidopterella palustris CBS 459.81 TaxID=1314670 RepID=A0A8E2EJP9_9PEZI|nr:glycoside hydrolase family 3 protein [Lepidopterella palustris CBS 459.81]
MAESYELRGKYSRLDAPEPDSPVRRSLDNAYRSSSELEDLDEFDPLNYDAGTLKRKKTKSRRPRGESLRGKDTFQFEKPNQKSRCRCCVPTRMCCGLVLLFVAAVVLLLSAGGIWAWKTAPADGQSPPWYPTPKGGTDAKWEESYKKAAELVRQMTLVEKVNITTGTGWSMQMCVGNTGPVARLGFPSLCLQDGPLGIRFADNITAFPAGVTVGATWNKDLMYEKGRAHALEAKLKGINVLLGPAMGPLGRMPAGGRNWEGFGSDPVLQGIAAAQMIKGIQVEGVMATAKHFVGNEQEHFRQSWEWGTPNAISSNIDDRTLHELYAWPFAESIRAGVASIMCSYNQVNNSYACGNSKLMNGILKDELGFQGFVQSDWLAQRSGVASALAGLDMSMPGDGLRWADGKPLWGSELTKAVLNSSVPMDRLDDMVTRIVAAWYQVGQDDKDKWPMPPPEGDGGPNFSSWTNDRVGFLHHGSDDKTTGVVNKFVNVQGEGDDFHGHLARRIAAEGTVLVKNEDNILPLNRNGWKKDEKAGKEMKYRVGVFGEDARANQNGPNSCVDRACNTGTLAQAWGSGSVDFPYLITPIEAIRKSFNEESVYVTDWPANKLPTEQEGILHDQDLCIVFANADAGEGYLQADGIRGDRNNLYTQHRGDYLIKKVAEGCGNNGSAPTIVVIHAVGPVMLENFISIPGVKAVLLAHLPGQESGNALTDVLFGDVNPSGRLPYTIAKNEDDYGPTSKILYLPNNIVPQQNFTEGLYIDYRHFDKYNITPRFEFGYGLSYTTFHLSSLLVNPKSFTKTLLPAPRPAGINPPSYPTDIPDPSTALAPPGLRKLGKYIYPYIFSTSDVKKGKYPYPPAYHIPSTPSPAGGAQGGNPDLYTTVAVITATLTNTGPVTGDSVVQLYITYPPDYVDEETGEPVDFPVRVLRGFQKVRVEGGDAKQKRAEVKFELTRKDLSYWDVRRGNWVMPTKGEFGIEVGFSSRDLPLKGKF